MADPSFFGTVYSFAKQSGLLGYVQKNARRIAEGLSNPKQIAKIEQEAQEQIRRFVDQDSKVMRVFERALAPYAPENSTIYRQFVLAFLSDADVFDAIQKTENGKLPRAEVFHPILKNLFPTQNHVDIAEKLISEIDAAIAKDQGLVHRITVEDSRILRAIYEKMFADQKRDTPFMVEDVPEDFVARPEEFDRLIDLLLKEDRREPVAITAALKGAGGYGKTTLARAICHDERVRSAFKDGILWVTLGEKPDNLTQKVEDLIYCLSKERPGFSDAPTAGVELGKLLTGKQYLLVIDDVWNNAHLRPFLQGGNGCARLITTRNSDTLPPKTAEIPVDRMKQDEGVELLTSGLPEGETTALKALAKRLRYWPLLLKLTNKVLQREVRQQSLKDALAYVDKALTRKGLTAFDEKRTEERHQAAAATIGVSLELLAVDEQEHFTQLAIFPEDINIPVSALEKLWGMDDFDCIELCKELFNHSLLLDLNIEQQTIRLHDVMRDFLQQQMDERLAETHKAFLDAYSLKHWWELPEDEPYLWENIAYHLKESRQEKALRALLLDYRWLAAKLEKRGVNALLADFDALPDNEELKLLQGALRLSAHVVSRDAKQLPGQLLGRLLGFKQGGLKSLLKQIAETVKGCQLLPLQPTLEAPGGALLRTLTGHSGGVRSVALSADGSRVVSGSDDNTLKVWDMASGEELRTLTGHSGGVRSVALSADGSRVVSGSDDNTLKVW
ncbi:MAG: hypothetical protein H6540_09755, partial [Bacteroidales bacterium]|nr:hypothetical protein [Bacteroidales bacterium]